MPENKKKIKVFVIADHPYAPSGVGTQTKYMIDALIATGRYEFVCFGGAMKHPDYQPQKSEEHGEDLIIFPVDGYGTQEQVRSLLWSMKPDILWFTIMFGIIILTPHLIRNLMSQQMSC